MQIIQNQGWKIIDISESGKIIKTVNAASADSNKKVNSVVIEEINIISNNETIRNLEIVRTMQFGECLLILTQIATLFIKYLKFTDNSKDGSFDDGKLIIVTSSQVIAIKLHRCDDDKITSCSECVAMQDPYCAWDKIVGKCRSHGAPRWLEENYFYQNVATGQHAACPSGEFLIFILLLLLLENELSYINGSF